VLSCSPRSQELASQKAAGHLRFLKHIDEQTPSEVQLHLIVDNYSTHKHPKVKAWLARHRRFHLHFTPTSASWLNMWKDFFGISPSKPSSTEAFKASETWLRQSTPILLTTICEPSVTFGELMAPKCCAKSTGRGKPLRLI
jgi:hypothetical protein